MSKICERCVMDDENTKIIFSESGICNYCTEALELKEKYGIMMRMEKKS